MKRGQAVQNAVNAIHVATTAIKTWGPDSTEAGTALQTALDKTDTARSLGATEHDFRTTQPG
jgi:hypothetical protein